MKPMYSVSMTASGGREGSVVSTDGKLKFQLAMPKELGGKGGEGTNPEQLFAAGYAACFASAIQFAAMQKKVKLEHPSVQAQVAIGKAASGGFGLAVQLKVTLEGLDQQTAESLVEAAHQICPYSNATRGNIPVDLTVEV